MIERRFAVIGHPVSRSLSPAMHNAAFRALGLPFNYEAREIEPGALARELPGLRAVFSGFNVTMPLKNEAARLMQQLHGDAAVCGSVNTVVCDGDGVQGYSTDGDGLLAALARAGVTQPAPAAVLGTGGAAAAAAAALLRQGGSVVILGRNWNAGRLLAHQLREAIAGSDVRFIHLRGRRAITLTRIMERVSVLVNATPLGDSRHVDESPIPAPVPLRQDLVVCDLVSVPDQTLLIRNARSNGCRTVTGIDVLVEQGIRSFEIWTGTTPPRSVMYDAASGVGQRQQTKDVPRSQPAVSDLSDHTLESIR